MAQLAPAASPAHIGAALAPIRAAISVVSSGMARSVVVHDAAGASLLAAARALARAKGLIAEPIPWPDSEGCDIRIRGSAGG